MNPFNAVWDTAALKVTLDQLSIMWLRSNGCIREFPDNSLSYMNDDTRTVICEFDLTPHQCNILKLRSAYYADIFSFMDTDFTKNVKITVDNPFFDATMVKHLILLNARGKDELPDYKLVNVGQFVHICAYYSFDRMLDLMTKFCLTTGVHYFPEFFEAMVFNFRIYHPSIASLWRMFMVLWNQSQKVLLHEYFLPDYPYLTYQGTLLGGLLFKHKELLPGMVRSFIQSPSLRMESPFLVSSV